MSLPSYNYASAVLYAINLVGQGVTLTSACDQANVPITTYKQLVEMDETLKALHEDAVQRGNDALVDALIDVDTHRIYGHTDSKMAKVQSDNIKWVLAKRDPERFGEKISVKHDVTLDRVITDVLMAAKQRSDPALPAPYIEDAVIVDDEAELLRSLMYG